MDKPQSSIRCSGGVFRSSLLLKANALSEMYTVSTFEIELPLENSKSTLIDGQKHPFRTDTVIVAKPGQKRCSQLPYFCQYLHVKVFDPYLFACLMALPNSIVISDAATYLKLMERIASLCDAKTDDDILTRQYLVLKLICKLKGDIAKTENEKNISKNNVVQKIIAYIKEDLTRDLRLEAVADYVFLSPTYLHTLFLSQTGFTLREYVENTRIEYAADLLTHTTLTLTEVAFASGFHSQSYFSSVFKKRRGLTPRQYSKKVSERYPLRLAESS